MASHNQYDYTSKTCKHLNMYQQHTEMTSENKTKTMRTASMGDLSHILHSSKLRKVTIDSSKMFSPETIIGSEALTDNQIIGNVSAMPKKASKVYETRSRNNFSKSFH